MPDIAKDHDPQNPDPWMALLLDNSNFIDARAKEALLRCNASKSRQFLFPVVRPFARLLIVVVQFLRIFIPRKLTSSTYLHRLICWGMKHFLKKEANYLILRHFHLGSQILAFLNQNLTGGQLSSHPLKPEKIDDLADHMFVQHDLNVFNFVIELNQFLKQKNQKITLQPLDKIDFSMIENIDEKLPEFKDKKLNFMDLHTAIETYTPLFGVFLSDDDFWRASNSLQLDETIAIYVTKLLGYEAILSMVHNKHPMVPLATFEAGFRLMLHGLDAENLYGFLCHMKAEQQALK